jgi:peptide-methionine (R)-S-oxide reductase
MKTKELHAIHLENLNVFHIPERGRGGCILFLDLVSDKYMDQKIKKTEEEWRKELTPEQYRILRQKGTEAPFTGIYESEETPGIYRCAACGQDLFQSETKYHSGSGWPSFYQPIDLDRVNTVEDTSHGMRRVEVTCSRCGGHLGHVFPDGPNPTGTRFCINSASLKLDPEKVDSEKK